MTTKPQIYAIGTCAIGTCAIGTCAIGIIARLLSSVVCLLLWSPAVRHPLRDYGLSSAERSPDSSGARRETFIMQNKPNLREAKNERN